MKHAVQVFEYEGERPFRTLDRNGEPWFVLNDVCRELGVINPRNAAKRLDDDEKDDVCIMDAIGRDQSTTIINESGLYNLILASRKKAAKKFKKWVTAEVLPSIRRTGSYGVTGIPKFIRRYNANWDRVAKGHFSVISELAIRLWGRLEQEGCIMADKAPDGKELRPDVSVGKLFSTWLKKNYPEVADDYSYYQHVTAEAEFAAREYPNRMLEKYLHFVDNVWIPENAELYFSTRDPVVLEHLPKLIAPATERKTLAKGYFH